MNNTNASLASYTDTQRYQNMNSTNVSLASNNIVRPETLTDKHFDKQTAQEFLDILGASPYVFQTFDDRASADKQDDRDPSLTKTFYGTLEQHYNKLVEVNKRGAGIFVTVNETSGNTRKAEDVVSVRACFIDCDKQLPKDSYHLDPTMIVRTSGKRGHAYWVFDTPDKNVTQFKDAQKKLIEHYASDKAVHDLPRVMRIPGFYHMKYIPTLVELVRIDPKCKYKNITEVVAGVNTQAVLRNRASADRAESNVNPRKVIALPSVCTPITNNEFKVLLFDVQNAVEGTRNDILNKAAFKTAELITNGAIAYDVAHQALVNAGVQAGLSEAEARRTVDSGISGGTSKALASDPRSKSLKLSMLLQKEYSHRLSWDVLKDVPRLDGIEFNNQELELDITHNYDIDVDYARLERFISVYAKKNLYHPVQEYLNSLEIPANTDILDTLYNDVLGLKTELEKTYVRKTLIAAVARALEPGCKVDTALILNGKQGCFKTTFFEKLFSEDFFTTVTVTSGNERDDLPVFHASWCVEFGELETVIKRKEVSQLKAFMTRSIDRYTPKYSNTQTERRRGFICVGTTNKDEFLKDPTGNRRFWICSITKKIDVRWVEIHRDEIWSAALKLYKAKEQWWLTDEEQVQSNEHNEQFTEHSTSEEWVLNWFSGRYIAPGGTSFKPSMLDRGELTTAIILQSALGVEPSRQNKALEMEVADVMTRLGFKKERKTLAGTRRYVWVHQDITKVIAVETEEESAF
ncbi:hypothetical protein B4U84_24355 [Westiellopsis prolifica IICB1]|nr:hypothetical protein B4U84_24355 [Westiellopsis prolifica IICB1]